MILNVHAGHAPANGTGCGAVGLLNESIEDRAVKNKLIEYLREYGHTVYDCTCDRALSQNDVLKSIVTVCNQHKVDYDISIHLNSGRSDYNGDGSTGGVEVYGYDNTVEKVGAAISENISKTLGIRNRGFKTTSDLYVLNNTHSKALLIECCFVDDKDDVDKWNAAKCAEAIFEGLTGTKLQVVKKDDYPHYRVHQQGIGWDSVKHAGEIAGVTGKGLRVEALKIDWPGHHIEAKAHIQGKGWVDYSKINSSTVVGSVGNSKRLECLCLTGDFEYRLHIQGTGWTAWTKADGIATLGTVGQALRIEAIQIKRL